MSKKLLALMLAGVMTLSCPIMTMAEAEEEATEEEVEEEVEEETAEEGDMLVLDYSMIDEDVYEGTWITAFGVFDLYLPSDWDVLVNVDLENDEIPENGVFFQAVNEDQTNSVAISYAQTEDMDLEGLAAKFAEAGFEEVALAIINEIPVVTYSVKADGVSTAGIATIGDQGGMYNVTIGCPEDAESDFLPIAQNILCSFSATEIAEDAEEAEEAE